MRLASPPRGLTLGTVRPELGPAAPCELSSPCGAHRPRPAGGRLALWARPPCDPRGLVCGPGLMGTRGVAAGALALPQVPGCVTLSPRLTSQTRGAPRFSELTGGGPVSGPFLHCRDFLVWTPGDEKAGPRGQRFRWA